MKTYKQIARIFIFILFLFVIWISPIILPKVFAQEELTTRNLSITPTLQNLTPTKISTANIIIDQYKEIETLKAQIDEIQKKDIDSNVFSTIASTVAIVIGILAFGVSTWEVVETRKNFRLSVKPVIDIDCSWLTEAEYPGVSFINNGVGPAIITQVEITFENNRFDLIPDSQPFFKKIDNNERGLDVPEYNFDDFCCVVTIPASKSIPIIWLPPENSDDENVNLLKQLLVGSSIIVRYNSIYDQPFTIRPFFIH